MPMGWTKCGRILEAPRRPGRLVSHAAVPIAEAVEGDIYRVYYSARDDQNRSHVISSLVEFGPTKPTVLQTDVAPLLSPGRAGAFDDSGAMGCWLVSANSRKHLYYIGWNLGVTVPFRNAVGVAISDDGGASFTKYSEGPVLDRDTCDPFFIGSACVLIENDVWRMWYASCVEWVIENAIPTHRYHIKYAESKDGIRWNRTGIVAVDFASADEYAISRPSVVRDGHVYRMWYRLRGPAYRSDTPNPTMASRGVGMMKRSASSGDRKRGIRRCSGTRSSSMRAIGATCCTTATTTAAGIGLAVLERDR